MKKVNRKEDATVFDMWVNIARICGRCQLFLRDKQILSPSKNLISQNDLKIIRENSESILRLLEFERDNGNDISNLPLFHEIFTGNEGYEIKPEREIISIDWEQKSISPVAEDGEETGLYIISKNSFSALGLWCDDEWFDLPKAELEKSQYSIIMVSWETKKVYHACVDWNDRNIAGKRIKKVISSVRTPENLFLIHTLLQEKYKAMGNGFNPLS